MHVIDSHTGGQPTRVIVDGGPELGSGPLTERKRRFAEQFDDFRKKSVLEPKCADAMVGALLVEPSDPSCSAAVIFFNNSGYLDMCGHGTIGLMVTLGYLGRIEPGSHRIETSADIIDTQLLSPNRVSLENVASYCLHRDIAVEVEGLGTVTGSVAWGGNWFFLAQGTPAPLIPENIPVLTYASTKIRHALNAASITGTDGAEINHIEFFEKPAQARNGLDLADSRNFVLCPGLAYDRSPCGTGTSAKIAYLAESGTLAPGEEWVQESIIGSRFHGRYRFNESGAIIPTIIGDAYVYADSNLVFQPNDPFLHGIG